MYFDNRGTLLRTETYNVHRRDARYVLSVGVSVQRFLRFGPFQTRGVTLDVSQHGMSALVCGAPRTGETVVIELALPDALLELLATVRHSSNAKSGFEFYPMSRKAQQDIAHWIEQLNEQEELLFPYPYSAAILSTNANNKI